jgi:hypothetical protein
LIKVNIKDIGWVCKPRIHFDTFILYLGWCNANCLVPLPVLPHLPLSLLLRLPVVLAAAEVVQTNTIATTIEAGTETKKRAKKRAKTKTNARNRHHHHPNDHG